MAVLTSLARDVITSGRLAHLVTVNADGSPQTSVVWVGLDGDEIASGTWACARSCGTWSATRASCCRSRPGTATRWTVGALTSRWRPRGAEWWHGDAGRIQLRPVLPAARRGRLPAARRGCRRRGRAAAAAGGRAVVAAGRPPAPARRAGRRRGGRRRDRSGGRPTGRPVRRRRPAGGGGRQRVVRGGDRADQAVPRPCHPHRRHRLATADGWRGAGSAGRHRRGPRRPP
jgi:hypothetical protein